MVLNKRRARQTLSQGIRDHLVCAERNKLHDTRKHELPHEVTTDVDMAKSQIRNSSSTDLFAQQIIKSSMCAPRMMRCPFFTQVHMDPSKPTAAQPSLLRKALIVLNHALAAEGMP